MHSWIVEGQRVPVFTRMSSGDLRSPALIVLAVGGALLASSGLWLYSGTIWLMADAHAYWLTGQEHFEPYEAEPGALDAYLYSPAFAHLTSVLTWLPWPAFAVIWLVLETAAFLWLFRPLGWAWSIVLLLWCSPELLIGNIYGFLAVSIALGLSGWPQAWAAPILTKPVLGIAMIWHVVRGEWRSVASGFAVTGGVVVVSYLVDPEMWMAWVQFLMATSGSAGWFYVVRVAAASGVVVMAANGGLPWLVPFALLLAMPVVGGIAVFTILASVPRLVVPSHRADCEVDRVRP